jgi:hypothetical protein
MPEDPFLQKLRDQLTQEIRCECQVVCILVQIRKLMEKLDDGDDFLALTFYCDWIVHSEMTRRPAKEILGLFNTYQAMNEQMILEGTMPENIDFLVDLDARLRLKIFRDELAQYLERHALDATIARDDAGWARFLTHYTSAVQDCPLRASGADFRYVSDLNVRIRDTRSPGNAEWTLLLEWEWQSRTTGWWQRNHQFF